MTESKINESLKAAVEEMTPNMLDALMSELDITDEPKELMHDTIAQDSAADKNWIPVSGRLGAGWMKAVISCAAVLVLVVESGN